ncbi:MAG: P1 family peptidase [Boseongicola sp.]|nr:P1 family peptidase [Boseongicola sp.]
MRPGPWNTITDVPGLSVGQAGDATLKTGVTVLVGDKPMVAGVHIMGGAPGTRETDLLRPVATVERIDALILSGGSAFGLAAADGVMAGLRSDGRGYEAAGHRIPIVPAAILFDLANGGEKNPEANPYPALGAKAYRARGSDVACGSFGAGTGATVAGLKGGIGTASAIMPDGTTVGALVAVNALGQVTVGDGPHFWAAPFEEDSEFGGLGSAPAFGVPVRTKFDTSGNTTIGIVATDAALTKGQATRLAIAAHDGIARSIVPAHTPMDGDLIFAASTGRRELADHEQLLIGHVAATCVARAVARAIFHATPAPNDRYPVWSEAFG